MNALPPLPSQQLMSERRVTLIGALLVAVGPISMALFTPAMPEIAHAFATSEAAVKMTLSVYFAGFAFAQLVCGPLSDGLGRKPVTFGFMIIYLAGSFLALFAPSIEVLIAARFLQGVGAAVGVAISRALVRDLFVGESSARIMNMIGVMLAVGPAVAPTLGGLTLELAGWHAIFALMVLLGIGVILVVQFGLRETVARDLSRIRPRALLASYRKLVSTPYFMTSSLVIAGSVGALYTLAGILPFVVMDRVGLTPTEFGIGMLMQSGLFLCGALCMRHLMKSHSAFRLVPIGLACIGLASVALAVLLRIAEPSFLGVMGPVGVYAFGIAFVMPAMTVAAMAPFPRVAGSAASMLGFMQMGSGLVGGSVAALIGEPVLALATVVPVFGATAIVSWLIWRRLPEPVTLVPHPPVQDDVPVNKSPGA